VLPYLIAFIIALILLVEPEKKQNFYPDGESFGLISSKHSECNYCSI